MLLKWKCILTNWIKCYCHEKDSQDINLDSLLIIISHLRRNLSLDDSRSSLLEAHNIHEFIFEKYPEFKFENETREPHTDTDLYLSASLLLFFVCVNSKNIDLKNVMCSKLSASDQETIMKFSKCLMGCTNITSSDVLQAITEACGQDIAGVDTVSPNTVAETPPALRSLHSEVRRLQAALDAERFDRNYLQEELSRTNLKLEKLSKLKEQYKMEIINLKAKVSDCCGEDNDIAGKETSHNNSVKLAKQLEQAEERLANLQEELSNVEYERNGYKTKLDELKRDREKYLALSQQENIRASQLAEELDSERRQCNSLRELVTELRQHNRLNRMDSSLLECDELDTSVHSFQHNSSVCSEVCASIIEVQLAEERTKITTLKNQIQMLQDQLTELNKKHEKEKTDFSKTLSEKEYEIMNLKHRINEEIECKNVMKSQCDNDMTKLNNEINELEQTLKDTTENARKTIDAKMEEIQTLQEEKLSLLQSFSNETSKLETKIQELTKDIEGEKASKQKIREDYDNHVMKLNEKVLNRNNELVELQNKIVLKGEEIENLQLQLRNEKDMRQELINKHNNNVIHYNNVIKEQNIAAQKSSEEIAELRKQVQQYYQCIEEMNKERNDLNTTLQTMKEEVMNCTSEKQALLKEKEKLQHEFDEKNETINSLKSQLQTEIQYKNEIQCKLHEVESHKELLSEEKTSLGNKLSKMIAENSDACEKLNQCIAQEKETSQCIQLQLDNSAKKIEELMEMVEQKKDMQKQLKEKENEITSLKEELEKQAESIKQFECLRETLSKERDDIAKQLNEKDTLLETEKNLCLQQLDELQKLQQVQTENLTLKNVIKEKESEILVMKEHLKTEADNNQQVREQNKQEQMNLANKCKILEQSKLKAEEDLKHCQTKIEVLISEMESIKNVYAKVELQKNTIIEKVETELQETKKNYLHFKQEAEKLKMENGGLIENLNELNTNTVCNLQMEKELLLKDVAEQENQILAMKDIIKIEADRNKQVSEQNRIEQMNLANKCQILEESKLKAEEELKHCNNKIEVLVSEMESIKHEYAKVELEKNTIIEKLESELQETKKNFVHSKQEVDKLNVENRELMETNTNTVFNLKKQNELLLEAVNNKETEILMMKENLKIEADLNHQVSEQNRKEQTNLANKCHILEQSKLKAEEELKHCHTKIEVLVSEMESIKNEYAKVELEKNKIIEKVETQLQETKNNYLHFKQEAEKLKMKNRELMENLDELNTNTVCNLKKENELILKTVTNKETEICMMKEYLKTEADRNQQVSEQHKIEQMNLANKCKILEEYQMKAAEELKHRHTKIEVLVSEMESIKNEYTKVELENNTLIEKLESELQKTKRTLVHYKQEAEKLKLENVALMENLNEVNTNTVCTLKEENELLLKAVTNAESLQKQLNEKENEITSLKEELEKQEEAIKQFKCLQETLSKERDNIAKQLNEKDTLLETEKNLRLQQLDDLQKLQQVQTENNSLQNAIKEKESEILVIKQHLKTEADRNQQVIKQNTKEQINLANKCQVLEEYQMKADEELKNHQTKIGVLVSEMESVKNEYYKVELEKNTLIEKLETDLQETKKNYLHFKLEAEKLNVENGDLMENLNELNNNTVCNLKKENELLLKAVTDNESLVKEKLQEKENEITSLKDELGRQAGAIKQFECLQETLSNERDDIAKQLNEKDSLLETEKNLRLLQLDELQKLQLVQTEKNSLQNAIKEKESEILVIKEHLKIEADRNQQVIEQNTKEQMNLANKCQLLEEYQMKADEELKNHQTKIEVLVSEMESVKNEYAKVELEKNTLIEKLETDLQETKKNYLHFKLEAEKLNVENGDLMENLNELNNNTVCNLKKENELLLKAVTDNESLVKEKLQEKENEITSLKDELERQAEAIKQFECLQETLSKERDDIAKQLNEKNTLLETEKNLRLQQLGELQKLQQVQTENNSLQNVIKEKESEILVIKEHLKTEANHNQQVIEQNTKEQMNLANKCQLLEKYQTKAEEELKHRQIKIDILVSEMESVKNEYAKVELDKNTLIEKLETELQEIKNNYLHYKQEAEKLNVENRELMEHLNTLNTNTLYNLKKENELLLKAVTNKENLAMHDKENIPNYREDVGVKMREKNAVHDSAFDCTTSSVDSLKTITDLEKMIQDKNRAITDLEMIIQDKNRTITTLHSDVTYLKTLIAESENKLLDVSKDLELSKENCHQLSNQLKKVVLQKNEEIAELKNKVTKMSATETRATQIIKLSAKYQAMILKRIAEIKNNTVLKELTNFGNFANMSGDNELRRSFNAGNITMEDLENFLETTDRHLKRCSEKQVALQKERDRLFEINKINDSEIIAMRKFLTELSISVKTFNSVKELYSQKLNRVIVLQRTVRREILNLDGRINDATMCKLERGYAAIMQDLSECALNLERWVDRSIVRSISPEKIKQAFMSELDRASLVPTNFQNTSLEIQFGELESSFQKLLKEVMQAQSGEGAKDAQALTLMEVRAEYEDKLSRMKAKMKELYVDQISQFQEKQKKQIEEYERKLQEANDKIQESSEAYREHIRGLTTELWNVGEKYIIQKDEAQWLRKHQKSGSLMSLQHVHSTGLVAPHEDAGRPSDTHSLRSLQIHTKNDKKGRKTCTDMSDEEGEVFDNRCLRELTETPRRARPSMGGAGAGGGASARLSELQRRNTLCRPHLKSSYPAETQFVPGLHEEDIKCNGSMSLGGKGQRKEVGITAYKKPGPPTPSKQAGRLSATDSELRESLRVEMEPGARRTATPSRLFGLFRGKQDTIEGTPRRRLSNIFRKK